MKNHEKKKKVRKAREEEEEEEEKRESHFEALTTNRAARCRDIQHPLVFLVRRNEVVRTAWR